MMGIKSTRAQTNSTLNPSNHMLPSDIESLVDAARWVPSGDNCQPWKFSMVKLNDGEMSLEIHYSEKRGRHALNNMETASFLSLGMVLQSIEMKATQLGFTINAKFPDSFFKTPVWARLTFTQLDSELSNSEWSHLNNLNEYIPQRRTDRRLYKKGFLKLDEQKFIQESSEEFRKTGGVRLQLRPHLSKDFRVFMAKAEAFMWVHPNVLIDFLDWVRFSKEEYENEQDGMWWRNLGIHFLETLALKRFRANPLWPQRLWSFGMGFQIRQKVLRSTRESGGFFAVMIKDSKPDTIINAGRLVFETWLYLGSKGYGVQPLSLSSLTLFDFIVGHAPSYANEKDNKFYVESLALWKKEFNMEEGEVPLWLFRFGVPKDTEPVPQTKRFDIKKLMLETV